VCLCYGSTGATKPQSPRCTAEANSGHICCHHRRISALGSPATGKASSLPRLPFSYPLEPSSRRPLSSCFSHWADPHRHSLNPLFRLQWKGLAPESSTRMYCNSYSVIGVADLIFKTRASCDACFRSVMCERVMRRYLDWINRTRMARRQWLAACKYIANLRTSGAQGGIVLQERPKVKNSRVITRDKTSLRNI
jgi:hypothetical protein